jgi:hypothetical protein
MCRLTSLGLGGILADDMGLGKTVQTLAYLLHRAAEGPSLVVAPTSVCSAWAEQAARFAPDLRVIRFGEGDREAALRGLGPGALVICSYGLLVSEIERLAPLSFAALVLDEAQAIKNTDTLRHQCVARIAARQRFLKPEGGKMFPSRGDVRVTLQQPDAQDQGVRDVLVGFAAGVSSRHAVAVSVTSDVSPTRCVNFVRMWCVGSATQCGGSTACSVFLAPRTGARL